jgi:hypothetical protein
MSVLSKNVFIVKCDLSLFNDSFSRKKNSEIINHHEIRQRLTNNDVFKSPPTNEIVNFQIIKRLNNFKECKKTEFLFIYQDSVDDNFVCRLKDFFVDSEFSIHYHLLIDQEMKPAKIKKHFSTVQIMDANWA